MNFVSTAAPRGPRRGDMEFLPAALEILDSPPSPVRMALIWLICALAATALIWSYWGHLDIVAEAQGKIQPTGRVKVVQPLETGKVKAVHVGNGAHVKAGDVLVELDATAVLSEERELATRLAAVQAEITRRRAAIAAARKKASAVPALIWAGAIPAAIREREALVLAGDLGQLAAALASLAAQRQQKQAEIERLIQTIAAQKALIATLTQRVTIRATLLERDAGTKVGLIDAQETLQRQQTALATETGQLAEARAALTVLDKDSAKTVDSFVADNLQRLAEAERQADELTQKLAKAQARSGHMILTSPLDGKVQASAITTLGQVVTTGEELMRIVPEGSVLEIEAYLANRDVGFIRPGQEVVIKIESFPFTRYGTLTGRVVHVAADAIPEPDAQQQEGNPAQALKSHPFTGNAQRTQNLVFPIIVASDASAIEADGARVPLSPGMAVTVEIKTGRRRILEYLFAPIVEVAAQAMKER